MRNDYEPNYLAHSKGPWKNHIYTAKKFINGKWRYIYGAASNTMSKAKAKAKRTGANLKNKVYAAPYLAKAYKTKARFAVKDAAKATERAINKVTGTTKSQRRAKVRVAKRNINNAINRGVNAINKMAKRTGANLKNKAYAAPYLAKAYKDKAGFAVKDAKKAINKKVTSYKNKRLAKAAIKNYGKASGMSAQMKVDKKARKQRERLNERNLRAARKKLKQQRKKNPNYGRSYTYTDSNGKRKTKVGYGKKSRRWTNNMRRIKDIHSVSTGSYT